MSYSVVARWLRLDRAQRLTLFEAVWTLIVSHFAIRFIPFRRIAPRLGSPDEAPVNHRLSQEERWEARRVGWAVTAHLETEILLIDEVLAVGDAQFQKKCLGKMEYVASEGRTILFVSHNMTAVDHLCSKGVLIEEGNLVRQGSSTDITAFYLDRAKKEIESRQNSGWPVFNDDESIGIASLTAKVIQDEANHLGKLVIEMDVIARQPIKKVGVGIALTTTRGVLVSNVKPAMTNYVIHDVQGNYNCVFECPEIGRYLASGEYHLGAWLSWPNVEYLVRVEDAARVTVPASDIYGEGVGFRLDEHGLVPLPVAFTFSHLS